jgi:uncharacterized protein (TIGR00725 family)
MKITIFGGSQPRQGDPAYETAYQLGHSLGIEKHILITGGYIGTMEAISRGGHDSGTQVIGVTCDQIESWRQVKPNAWISHEIRYATIIDRLLALIDLCETAIALPGGPGTMAEIALMWNLLLTGAITPRPLILFGDEWRYTFQSYFDQLGSYIPENQRNYLRFVPDISSVLNEIRDIARTYPDMVGP